MGIRIQLLEPTDFDYTSLSAAAEVDLILRQGIDAIGYRSGCLSVRLHSETMAGSAQTLALTLYPDAPSRDDPSVDFKTEDFWFAGINLLGSTTNAPLLVTAPLTGPLPPHMYLLLHLRQHNANTTFRFRLSAELTLFE